MDVKKRRNIERIIWRSWTDYEKTRFSQFSFQVFTKIYRWFNSFSRPQDHRARLDGTVWWRLLWPFPSHCSCPFLHFPRPQTSDRVHSSFSRFHTYLRIFHFPSLSGLPVPCLIRWPQESDYMWSFRVSSLSRWEMSVLPAFLSSIPDFMLSAGN